MVEQPTVGVVGLLFADRPLAVFQTPEEAALIALVADTRALRFDFDQQGVEVAVRRNVFYDQAMAGAFAFEP